MDLAVDWRMDPLGIAMLMAWDVSMLVWRSIGMSLHLKKCPVLPVSAMVDTVVDVDKDVVVDAGGPIRCDEVFACNVVAIVFMLLLTVVVLLVGSRPRQTLALGVLRADTTDTTEAAEGADAAVRARTFRTKI
jgi:hypothetical protein